MGSYSRDDAITYAYRALRDLGDDADSQLLTATEIGQFIDGAAKAYSLKRARTVVEDLTADGTNLLALPASWVDEVSRIVSIETPPDDDPPTYLDARYYDLYQHPDGWRLRFATGYAPGSGVEVRMTYTALRSFGNLAADTTVLDVDFEAVCALAIAQSAEAIASKYAQAHEPILNADFSGSRATKVNDWTVIARRWRDTYKAHMDSIRAPASGIVNWDTRLSTRDDHLTHPRFRR